MWRLIYLQKYGFIWYSTSILGSWNIVTHISNVRYIWAIVDSIWQKLLFGGKYGHQNVRHEATKNRTPFLVQKNRPKKDTSSENMNVPSRRTINTNIETVYDIYIYIKNQKQKQFEICSVNDSFHEVSRTLKNKNHTKKSSQTIFRVCVFSIRIKSRPSKQFVWPAQWSIRSAEHDYP